MRRCGYSMAEKRAELLKRVRSWGKRTFRLPVYMRLLYLVRVLKLTRKIYDCQQVTMAVSFMRKSEVRSIADLCLSWIEKRYPGREAEFRESRDDTGDYALVVYIYERCNPIRVFLSRLLYEMLSEGSGFAQANKNQLRAMEKRLDELERVFPLSGVERELLFYFHISQTDGIVSELYEFLSNLMHIKGKFMTSQMNARPISILTGIRLSEVNRALSTHSVLRRLQLLNEDGDLAPEIGDYLCGRSGVLLNEVYFRRFRGKALALGMHMVSPEQIKTVLRLCTLRGSSRGINILLYGEPGTGKTEFTKSLSRHLGTELYFVNSGSLDADPCVTRLRSLTACMNAADHSKTILVMDECDSLLNSQPMAAHGGKCLINSILDSTRGLVFWITNSIDSLDPSTARRFDFALPFRKFTPRQHAQVWQNTLRRHGMVSVFSREDIEQFVCAYRVSAGTVDCVVRNVSASLKKGIVKKRDSVEMARIMLKAQSVLDNESSSEEFRSSGVCDFYFLDGLNIKGGTRQVLSMVDNFSKRLGARDPQLPVRNMNLLLYGPPGTGKTEFARYLAGKLNRRLDACRMSDILGKFVGESEKNIRHAFSRAQHRGAVLFIDEADGLLASRDSAHHTWEVTQVNELLASMEQFCGILLCATNLRDHLDRASLRRFTLKLEFDYLTSDGAVVFYRRLLAPVVGGAVPEEVLRRLRSISSLTPGDFRNVRLQVSLRDRNLLSHELVADLLCREVSQRSGRSSKVIGFQGKGT